MKFSNNYIFYPDNQTLEQALDHYIELAKDDLKGKTAPDHRVASQDNFINTRGNYEQRKYSSKVLDDARDLFRSKLTDEYKQKSPLEWAAILNSLGNVQCALAQQMRDADLYRQAIDLFTQALEVFQQDSQPFRWAETQYNLGTATQALGRQLKDKSLLKKSIDAYTDALLEWSRKDVPEEWCATMFHLGAALHSHGLLLKGNRTLQKSVVAYKNALAELDADNWPLELSATHNNRGVVLQHLGESEENPDRIEEAIRSYETGLLVLMEQQQPFHLAVLCRVNLATARSVLSVLKNDKAIAEEAADEFELILACFPHALQPLCASYCEEQLKKAQEFTP